MNQDIENFEEIALLYSESAAGFAKKCLSLCKKILQEECGFSWKGAKLLHGNLLYPLHVITFEGGHQLGYFSPSLIEIGINKSLLFAKDDLLHEVLCHEMAHLIVYLEYGDNVAAHGKEFRSICHRYGWKEAMPASISADEVTSRMQTKIMGKISKLFELSSSKNAHEASAALQKARNLMIEHGIVALDQEEDFIAKRILSCSRSNEKLRSIATILRTFFVFPVINCGTGIVFLEIFGEKSHVEIAEYLAHLLFHKFDELWQLEGRKKGYSSLSAKHSFFRGIAEGFTQQMATSKEGTGLIKIGSELQKRADIAYPHLRHAKTSVKFDANALKEGKNLGSKLTLPKGIKEDPNSLKLLT